MSFLLQSMMHLGRNFFGGTGVAPPVSFLLLADGTSKILLANATDRILRAE